MGTTAGSVNAGDDVTATDDITAGDDLTVGGDATITGAVGCGAVTSTATGSFTLCKFSGQYTVATAPTGVEGDLAYFTDGDTGSKCLAFYDGSNWLRIALGTAIAAS